MHTIGSNFDTLLAVYTGASVSALTFVAANDQDMLDPAGGDTSRLKFIRTLGTTYFVAVDGFNGDTGAIVLTIVPPPRPPNDNFAERTPLIVSTVRTNGHNLEATLETGEPAHAGAFGGKSVWWSWTAPLAGTAIVTTLGSEIDTVLAVYSGDTVEDLALIAANDEDPLGTSRVVFEAGGGVPLRGGRGRLERGVTFAGVMNKGQKRCGSWRELESANLNVS